MTSCSGVLPQLSGNAGGKRSKQSSEAETDSYSCDVFAEQQLFDGGKKRCETIDSAVNMVFWIGVDIIVCLWPARKAARIGCVDALKCEQAGCGP